MNAQLNRILALERIADLERAAEPRWQAAEWDARQGGSRDSNRTTRFSRRLARLARRGARVRRDRSPTVPPTTRENTSPLVTRSTS
jgi:hypothetical protein